MASGVDLSGGFGRLNENVDLLLETVDAVAADVAASRSYLERLSRTIPDDPPTVNDFNEIDNRFRHHNADFHKWIWVDRP